MRHVVCLALILGFTTSLWAGPFMGQYEGTFHADSKVTLKAVGKVVDEGDRHRVVLYTTSETPIDQGAVRRDLRPGGGVGTGPVRPFGRLRVERHRSIRTAPCRSRRNTTNTSR